MSKLYIKKQWINNIRIDEGGALSVDLDVSMGWGELIYTLIETACKISGNSKETVEVIDQVLCCDDMIFTDYQMLELLKEMRKPPYHNLLPGVLQFLAKLGVDVDSK